VIIALSGTSPTEYRPLEDNFTLVENLFTTGIAHNPKARLAEQFFK
jgi:hypothetical protein